jgi:predicted nucleic acid-binding protein
MNRIVVDASVVAKAFTPVDERNLDEAADLMQAWDEQRLAFVAPELVFLEVMNVASRKWRLQDAGLALLADSLDRLEIDVRPVDLDRIVFWTARGLTAHDAAYVAVAEAAGISLVTDDDQIVAIAPDVAMALATFDMPA